MIALEEGLSLLCRRAFPTWTGLRVTEAAPLFPRTPFPAHPGQQSACSSLPSLALTVEGACGGETHRKELVWRCHAERESSWALDDPERAEREFHVLRALEARGFPVPRAYAWGREGGGWVLIDRVPGRPGATGPAARRDALGWLERLHTVAAESISQAPLPHVTLVGTLVRARTWGEEAGCSDVCAAAEACLRRAALPESTGRLLHGDAHPGRFRVERGRVVAWLGWASAAVGDPRWDLAAFLARCPRSSERHARGSRPGLLGALETAELGTGIAASLAVFTAALALRDWSAALCRTALLTRERGAEHPSVLARAPHVARLRRRCLAAVAALEAG